MTDTTTVDLNDLFKGKVIASVMSGVHGEVTVKTEDGYKLVLKPSFDVEYSEPE